ncbi:phospholipase A and acyltransferase 3-like [Amphiura filiformis]|uniref:phospholipase A and acyltransferase 3-like n=1 Tax=Amphiura filiformis TaxID=82378 RepID=UPI003B2185CA
MAWRTPMVNGPTGDTTWQDPDDVDALPGDKIEFNRGLYQHVGIADGKGGVYHFSGEPTQKARAYYRYDNIKEVAGNDQVRVNNKEDTKMKPLPRKEIVKRAKKAVDTGHGTYDLTGNNCEHKATEMRYGKPVSEQVDVGKAVGIAAVVTGIYAIGSLLFGGNNDDEEDNDNEEESDED